MGIVSVLVGSRLKAFLAGTAFSPYHIRLAYFIEFSQFYHAPWIDAIRSTTLGGLVLGFGFQLSDLIRYFVGVCIGYLLNTMIASKSDHA